MFCSVKVQNQMMPSEQHLHGDPDFEMPEISYKKPLCSLVLTDEVKPELDHFSDDTARDEQHTWILLRSMKVCALCDVTNNYWRVIFFLLKSDQSLLRVDMSWLHRIIRILYSHGSKEWTFFGFKQKQIPVHPDYIIYNIHTHLKHFMTLSLIGTVGRVWWSMTN